MKIVAISDTHCYEDKVTLPVGDVLLYAGDSTWKGRPEEVAHFRQWLDGKAGAFKKVIVIAGNHDLSFERAPEEALKILRPDERIIYLQDSGLEIDGIKFWGAPWTPIFSNWAFMKRPESIRAKWHMIPDDTNVLITHGPPFTILDETFDGKNVGCAKLYERIKQLASLKLHVFGHIHEGYGTDVVRNVKFANVSVCTVDYRPVNQPLVFNI
jgi:Icc-related predicted phosphoesterase